MKNARKFTAGAALAAVMVAGFGLPAMAGGMATPIVEPTIAPAAPVVMQRGGDWTGGYVGAQLGYGDVSAGANDGTGATYGVHGGYDHDFGRWVAGVGLDWDKTDIDLGAGTGSLDDIARLKFRVGADLGRTLVYATAGPARASASVGAINDTDSGWYAGIGADYGLNDRWTVGGEVLTNQFDNFGGTGIDVEATTVTAKVGLRF